MAGDSKRGGGGGAMLSLLAIVISLSALGVSVLEVTSLQGQQRASVWPYLEIGGNYSGEGYEIAITNKGIGPALLGDVTITLAGRTIASSDDLDAVILDTIGEDRAFSYDTYRASDASGAVLAPGEKEILFGVPWTPETRVFVSAVSDAMAVDACYCSVYKECWSVTAGGTPAPTKACRPE
ncbi:MAG: hypothetical protein AAGC56_06490 [Pseudomonadota bacterium]